MQKYLKRIAGVFLYHVLLISENRILLKKIYEMLEDPSLFRIHIVPFSMDAFDAFYDTHADIVILDTSVFLPFENILDQIYQYNWPFYILLIFHGTFLSYTKKENVFLLNETSLSKELFHEIIDNIGKHSSSLKNLNTNIIVNWDGRHSVLIHPDSYHILVIKTFDKNCFFDAAFCNTLITKTISFCNLHLIHTSNSIAIFYMNRSQIKKEFNFSKLSNLIFEILGQKTALFYKENISWKKLQSTLKKIIDNISLLYFLQGESKNFQKLQHPAPSPKLNDLKNQFSLLLNYLLDCNIDSAKHILHDMYIHTIKSSYDFSVLEYIRMQLQILYFLLFKEKIVFLFTCIEKELNWLLKSKLFIPITYETALQQDTIKKCILTLYKEYHKAISLDGIAKKLNLNKIYLNRLFKNQFHQTIAKNLQILRIQEAKYLLIFTNEKVYNIASHVGFSDTGYFIKTFRKITGYSALEFRLLKENKEDFKKNYESIMEI